MLTVSGKQGKFTQCAGRGRPGALWEVFLFCFPQDSHTGGASGKVLEGTVHQYIVDETIRVSLGQYLKQIELYSTAKNTFNIAIL